MKKFHAKKCNALIKKNYKIYGKIIIILKMDIKI